MTKKKVNSYLKNKARQINAWLYLLMVTQVYFPVEGLLLLLRAA